jgi:serine/threonine-protein kinase
MSPEQMRASKNVDRRTDIWSIGVILQELVSGEPSFVANTTAELCALVLTAPPAPLQLENAPPHIKGGLANVIEKCLKKTPEERYGTIAELARALESFGPSSVKTSVERIVRLATGQRPQQPSMSSAAKEISGPVSIVPAGQPAASSLGQTELSASPPAAVEAPPAPVVGAGTNATWDSSRGRVKPKMSRLSVYVAGGILAAIGVLVIAFALSRTSTPTHAGNDPTQTATATQTQAPTATATATATPTQTQTQGAAIVTATATTATATASATTTATATATVTATATTTTTAAHTGNAKPPASTGKRTGTAPVDTSGFGGRN